MKVKARMGINVPMENRPHSYIGEAVVEVEDSLYYQRRISDGDLIVVTEEVNTKASKVKEVRNEQ